MNDATSAWLEPDQIVTSRTRAAMLAAEALAWELMPRMVELSAVAGEAHAMVHAELCDVDEDDAFRGLAQAAGYERMREALDLVVGLAAIAADDPFSTRGRTFRLAEKYSSADAPVNVGALMDEWADTVGRDDWPTR